VAGVSCNVLCRDPHHHLNTTVAESGGRLLLSNYQVPGVTTLPPNTEFLPAESFLQAYAQDVVFAIPQQRDEQQKPKPAPLSWKLTASELAYISSVAHGDQSKATDAAVTNAMDWVAKAETSTPSSEVCNVANAPQ
jgi:hypothetical protein